MDPSVRNPVLAQEESNQDSVGAAAASKRRSALLWFTVGAASAAVVCLIVVAIVARRPDNGGPTPAPADRDALPGALAGVNLGGWLCLEDWFYSGEAGQDVMTLQPSGQGACLPPLLTGVDIPWPSEGFLTHRLNQSLGSAQAAAIFEAHRHSYIGEEDLAGIAQLGIRLVRLPLTWAAFADALSPIDQAIYGAHNADTDTAIVPDPFYSELAAFATVPRGWLAQFLRRANSHGLRVLLDLHAFPAGAADGTYNGVWPSRPAFWTQQSNIGDRNVLLKDAGLWVAKGLINWLEGLDDAALAGIAGVTLMNEPAHMAAIDSDAGKPFANESAVLDWLRDAADLFRRSRLPSAGKRLYMNIIETAFKNFDQTVVPWFHSTFSDQEQQEWAVMDIHWYTAWSGGSCDGRVSQGGGYFCDQPANEVQAKLRGCVSSWAEDFKRKFPGLRSITEFSVGTYSNARLACTDRAIARIFLKEQLDAFAENGIEPFFWTWRMPFGPTFEPGWSLKHVVGLEEPKLAQPCRGKWNQMQVVA